MLLFIRIFAAFAFGGGEGKKKEWKCIIAPHEEAICTTHIRQTGGPQPKAKQTTTTLQWWSRESRRKCSAFYAA